MAAPVRIAAIDAGSNAIRLAIAQAESPSEIKILETVRAPVRLGHLAFTKRRFSRDTIHEAARAFRRFRSLLDKYGIERYRAVATSAAREARNRDVLLRRVRRSAAINLEVIDSAEEARLVRSAILAVAGGKLTPRLIVDLGGGSLEISLLRNRAPQKITALPLGSVRLIEALQIHGAFSEDLCESLQHRVFSLLRSFWPNPPNLSKSVAIASGGNAEALARIMPGPKSNGIASLNLRLLRERLWSILALNIHERMEKFRVRRDRAEVIGVAAIVFAALSRWFSLRTVLVPGAGVKEGILWDLASAHFAALSSEACIARFEPLLHEARHLAARFHCNQAHAEDVRRLAAALFNQLAPVHKMPYEFRLPLEIAATLHESGRAISASSSHKHGEYILRHAAINGLSDTDRVIAACLVRYQGNSAPDLQHKLYSSLGPRRRQQVHALTAILRIALALATPQYAVQNVRVLIHRKQIRLRLYSSAHVPLPLAAFRRSVKLFEKDFRYRVRFGRARARKTSLRSASSYRT